MSATAWAQFALLIVVLGVTAPLLGRYVARVYGYGEGVRAPGDRFFLPVERLVYRICRVDPEREQHWTRYALSLLSFSAVGFLALYALLRTQGALPLNPLGLPGLEPNVAFNVAASFLTNTDWQPYTGETTMSYFTDMAALTFQNFTSAAVSPRPLWNFTPLRSLNVHARPSALVVQDSASTGRILRSRSKSTSPW